MKIAHCVFAALVLCGLSSVPALAQFQQVPPKAAAAAAAPTPHANDDCLACHGDPSADRAVSPTVFAASVHGQAGIGCVDCHKDVATAELPHAERLAPVGCATCHDQPAAQYERSVHAEARRAAPATSVAASCKDCHGTHDIRPASDPESWTYHLNLARTCGACHGNADIIKRGGIRIGNVLLQFQDSIHGRALARGGLMVAPACTDCHGAHDVRRRTSAESRIFRTNVPATCGKCHEGVEHRYEDGVHGTSVRNGNTFAPVCSNCHTAHQIQRVDIESWKLQVLSECGSCHAESIRTYRDTFHGQVTALGFVRTAACADCHGAHEIFPKNDPRSTISQARIIGTCSKCHPGATPGFVRYDPHADKHNKARNPVLYYASRFMSSLLVFVFAFFGVHTTLWFARSVRAKKVAEKAAGGGKTDEADPAHEADAAHEAEKTDE
jgi:nitrate/TMAO reductase-like tetraheme cytochrome c subunit